MAQYRDREESYMMKADCEKKELVNSNLHVVTHNIQFLLTVLLSVSQSNSADSKYDSIRNFLLMFIQLIFILAYNTFSEHVTRWKLSPDPNCTLSTKPANLKHILSECSVSLQQGRYRWRHDQTLAVIAHHLELSLKDIGLQF